MKRILVITARFPLPALGACEQDRFEGIKALKRLGFEVSVIAKVFSFQPKEEIERFSREFGIPVKTLPYENKFSLKRILSPLYWDGAAYEYSHASVKDAVESEIKHFQPDLIWVDYTYLWPLYSIFKKRKIPVITRSINFEPAHFLQEDGYSPLNLIKFLSKLAGELITIKNSGFLFAITPNEEKIYRKLGAKSISILPLRGLPEFLDKRVLLRDRKVLNVIFMGSTYTVSHNRAALKAILEDIAPAALEKCGGCFKFYISGRKVPAEFEKFFGGNIVYAWHKDRKEFDEFLKDMDIAIVPSLYGAGMQQKIFEPLCRGIPTAASLRGLAGYPFLHRKHLLAAKNIAEFADLLLELRDLKLRKTLSENSVELARKLFSREVVDKTVVNAVNLCAR